MATPEHTKENPVIALAIARIACAWMVWLLLGLSLGWYYTITYYGRAGWPMPVIEPCAALILYYFSVLNADTEVQAVHWLIVFPVAGTLWCIALHLVFRRMHGPPPPLSRTMLFFALASVPMILPAPWLMWLAAQTDQGVSLDRMIAVALRRGNIWPWPTLSPMYFALGLIGLALQAVIHRRVFALPLRASILHVLIAAVILTLASIVLGTIASFPLRALFE